MVWAPDYAEVADLKAYVSIPADDAVDDAQLAGVITAASRSVDQHCRRQFGKTDAPQVRTFRSVPGAFTDTAFIVTDVATLDGLSAAIDGFPVTLEQWWPANAVADGEPYTRLRVPGWYPGDTVLTLTAVFGWPAVPVAVVQATLLQASRLFHRRQSPYGIAGSPELGSELRLLAKVDPDVAVMLAPYVRRGTVA